MRFVAGAPPSRAPGPSRLNAWRVQGESAVRVGIRCVYNRQARSDRYKEDSAKSTEPGSINAATAGGHQPGVAQPGFTWSLSALTDTFGIEGQTLAVGELNPIVSHVTVGPDSGAWHPASRGRFR